jgi:hypothetical protein
MYRTPNSHGRRRPLHVQTFAKFSLAAACAVVVGLIILSGASVAATSQEKPSNTAPPAITGSAVKGQRLHATAGTWTGDQPITYRFRWLRCNPTGDECREIASASDNDYLLRQADIGDTLRVRVTARNDIDTTSVVSARTDVVQDTAPTPPSGRIQLPSGETSVAASGIPREERMIVSQVRFEPSLVTSRSDPITIRVRIADTRGFVVRDALVFVRATPRVTTGDRLSTGTDGWVTFQLQPLSTFPLKRGAVQFFVKAYRTGDPPLAGVAGYRLVQVRTAVQ